MHNKWLFSLSNVCWISALQRPYSENSNMAYFSKKVFQIFYNPEQKWDPPIRAVSSIILALFIHYYIIY